MSLEEKIDMSLEELISAQSKIGKLGLKDRKGGKQSTAKSTGPLNSGTKKKAAGITTAVGKGKESRRGAGQGGGPNAKSKLAAKVQAKRKIASNDNAPLKADTRMKGLSVGIQKKVSSKKSAPITMNTSKGSSAPSNSVRTKAAPAKGNTTKVQNLPARPKKLPILPTPHAKTQVQKKHSAQHEQMNARNRKRHVPAGITNDVMHDMLLNGLPSPRTAHEAHMVMLVAERAKQKAEDLLSMTRESGNQRVRFQPQSHAHPQDHSRMRKRTPPLVREPRGNPNPRSPRPAKSPRYHSDPYSEHDSRKVYSPSRTSAPRASASQPGVYYQQTASKSAAPRAAPTKQAPRLVSVKDEYAGVYLQPVANGNLRMPSGNTVINNMHSDAVDEYDEDEAMDEDASYDRSPPPARQGGHNGYSRAYDNGVPYETYTRARLRVNMP